MEDINYYYLAYGISKEYAKSAIFSLGVPICGKDINWFKHIIAYEDEELEYWKSCGYQDKPKQSEYKTFAILKIPKYYMGRNVKGETLYPYMPFIKTYFDFYAGELNYIIPELVLGTFDTETNEYIENSKYNSLYNPNGLQFCDMQMEQMKNFDKNDASKYAQSRLLIPYEVLKLQDELSGVFNSTIKFYEELLLVCHTKNYKLEDK